MFQLGKELVLLLFDKFIYISLLGIGCYFIHQGDVVSNFQSKGTNFAMSKETITELPTITTYLWPPSKDFMLGRDYNISYQAAGSHGGLNLTYGNNFLKDVGLSLNLVQLDSSNTTGTPTNWLKITPTNFLPGMQLDYMLTYTFKNPDIATHTQVGIILSTENNTLNCHGGKYYDGDILPVLSRLGMDNVLTISAEKFIYLGDVHKCREVPYIDQIIQFVEQDKFKNCSKACNPKYFYDTCEALILSEWVLQLPSCNEEDYRCLVQVISRVKDSMIVQPCTKLSYLVKNTPYYSEEGNIVIYRMNFDASGKVKVSKEYLVCDLIGMIGAIGGTLGLCIGFSFSEMASTIIKIIGHAYHRRNPITVRRE